MTTENPSSLFGDLPEHAAPERDPGAARYVEANREQLIFDQFELDGIIGEEHPARLIWAYVKGLDLSELYGRISAREHTPGRPPADPRVVLALWLYACVEGVGSARELYRLTTVHHGFRWLRGEVPLNHHLLSDFRWSAAEVADRLLTQSVTSLWSEGLVGLASLTHDGIRVRASAGASSFRRLERLEQLASAVEERIERLKQEIDDTPDASQRRQQAAQERVLQERQGRVVAALETARAVAAQQAAKASARKAKAAADDGGAAVRPGERPADGASKAPAGDEPEAKAPVVDAATGAAPAAPQIEMAVPAAAAAAPAAAVQTPTKEKKDEETKKEKERRFSTTDVEARVMRMPDGGYRPAYNVQLTGDLESGLIVGLGVDTTGSDGGLLAPAMADVERRLGRLPPRLLADGGYTVLDDIVALTAKAVTVFCPLKPRRNPGNDPAAPRRSDPPEVADWRRRMVDDAAAGMAGWMRRRGEHERINANLRNHGLQRFNVRGSLKVRVVCLLHALAHNFMTAVRLRAQASLGVCAPTASANQ